MWGIRIRTKVGQGQQITPEHLELANVANIDGRLPIQLPSGAAFQESQRDDMRARLREWLTGNNIRATSDLAAGRILRAADVEAASQRQARILVLQTGAPRGSTLTARNLSTVDRDEADLEPGTLRAEDDGTIPVGIWYGLQGRRLDDGMPARSILTQRTLSLPRESIFPETASRVLSVRQIFELIFAAANRPQNATNIVLGPAPGDAPFDRVWMALQPVLINEIFARHGLNFAHGGSSDRPDWDLRTPSGQSRQISHSSLLQRVPTWYPMQVHDSEQSYSFSGLQSAALERLNRNDMERQNLVPAGVARAQLLELVSYSDGQTQLATVQLSVAVERPEQRLGRNVIRLRDLGF